MVSLGVQQTLGLGIVIKATLLKELVDITVTKVKDALNQKMNRRLKNKTTANMESYVYRTLEKDHIASLVSFESKR